MTHLRIVSGTPGTQRDRICQRLERSIPRLKIDGRPASVQVRSLEQFIPKICPKDWYLPDTGKDPLLSILAQLPQDQVRIVWQKAFVIAAEEAMKDGPDLAVILTSLSYYRKETYEFYCPPDLKWMRE
jgi:hypothetical protein